MKKVLLLAVIVALMMAGCCGEAKRNAELNAARLDKYVQLMDAKQTTPEDDQAFIRANRVAWWAQHNALNGAELPADLKDMASTADTTSATH